MRIRFVLIVAALLGATGCGPSAAGHDNLALAEIVPGAAETQAFGCTSLVLEPPDSFCPTGHFHSGIDLAAIEGTAVHSASDGRARVLYDEAGAGLYVTVTSDDHSRVLYCHLSAVHVADGEDVVAGQVIGEVGSTGLSTGAHLHFEVDVDGRAVDPAAWLTQPPGS
jgi:murein DD-endopeptidase MepM/ murein hydrolase activator NlpD